MPLLSLYCMHECKYISSVMWPRLDRGANKKDSHLLVLKDLGFFPLFILFQEESSKFRQTVAVSFGSRNNLIKASPFKRGGEGEGRKENPSETEVTSFQPKWISLCVCVFWTRAAYNGFYPQFMPPELEFITHTSRPGMTDSSDSVNTP